MWYPMSEDRSWFNTSPTYQQKRIRDKITPCFRPFLVAKTHSILYTCVGSSTYQVRDELPLVVITSYATKQIIYQGGRSRTIWKHSDYLKYNFMSTVVKRGYSFDHRGIHKLRLVCHLHLNDIPLVNRICLYLSIIGISTALFKTEHKAMPLTLPVAIAITNSSAVGVASCR